MFGDILKQLRKSRNLTQQELADIIGVEQSSIGKYEGKDKKIPSDAVKERIADYFGVSIDFLMGRAESDKDIVIYDYDTLDLINRFSVLPPDRKRQLIEYAQFLQAFQPTSDASLDQDNQQDT